MPSTSVFVQARYTRSIYVGMLSSRIQLRGALWVAGDELTLEYRERWRSPSTLRPVEGKLLRVSALCSSLAEVQVVPRFFGGKWLILREIAFEALRAWPGARNGVCRFRLMATPQQTTEDAAGELALAMAEAQLRLVERSADQPE